MSTPDEIHAKNMQHLQVSLLILQAQVGAQWKLLESMLPDTKAGGRTMPELYSALTEKGVEDMLIGMDKTNPTLAAALGERLDELKAELKKRKHR